MTAAPRRPWLPWALCLGATASLYAATMRRALGGSGDSVTFQIIGGVAGIAHLTGYPLYTLLLIVAAQLPGLSPALAAHLVNMSAGAAAAGLLFGYLQPITRNPWTALGWTLGFALAIDVWRQAAEAEVYTLHLALLLALLHLARRWDADPTPRRLAALWFVAWLSLTHHLTAGAAWPALIWWVWSHPRRPRIDAAQGLRLALLAAAALLPYAYILLRSRTDVPYALMRARDLPELLFWLTGGEFRGRMFAFGPVALLTERLPACMGVLMRNVGLIGLPAVLLAVTARRYPSRRADVYALLWCGGFFFFALGYDVVDFDAYLLPCLLLLIIGAAWAGAGLDPARQRLLLPLVLLFAGGQAAFNFNAANLGRDTYDAAYARAVVAAAPPEAILLTPNWRMHQFFEYLRLYDARWSEKNLGLCLEFAPEHVAAYLRGEGPLYPGTSFAPGRPLFFPAQDPEPRPLETGRNTPIDWMARLRAHCEVEAVTLALTKPDSEPAVMYRIVGMRETSGGD